MNDFRLLLAYLAGSAHWRMNHALLLCTHCLDLSGTRRAPWAIVTSRNRLLAGRVTLLLGKYSPILPYVL